jgi:CRP/FNR family transcriptional regulator, cyclic AMP receptor protein
MDDAALQGIPLFEGLAAGDLDKIAGWLEQIDVPADWYLVNQGSSPVGFFVVVEGRVNVDREGTVLATLGPGDFFGEIALLEGDRRTATVITATQVRALVMDADEFAQMVEEVPDVKARIDAAALERGN